MKWEVLFEETTQKQVVNFQAIITASTMQTVAITSKTNCSDTTMEVDARVNSYTVVGSKLSIEGVIELERATDEQILKFSKVQEGCN